MKNKTFICNYEFRYGWMYIITIKKISLSIDYQN